MQVKKCGSAQNKLFQAVALFCQSAQKCTYPVLAILLSKRKGCEIVGIDGKTYIDVSFMGVGTNAGYSFDPVMLYC